VVLLAVLPAFAAGAGSMALLLGALGAWRPAAEANRVIPEPDRSVVCSGLVDAEEGVASLAPLQSGRVLAVPVREGQRVAAGEVLVEVDNAQAVAQLHQAQAEEESARAALDQARLAARQHPIRVAQQQAVVDAAGRRLASARHDFRRKQGLRQRDLLSAEELQSAEELVRELEALQRAEQQKQRDLELQDPQIGERQAAAEVRAREARREQAARLAAEGQVRAPSAGQVLRVLVSPGDLLGPGGKPTAVLFGADGPLIVRAEVPQEFADRALVGQAARIEDDAWAGPALAGRVLRVSNWYTQRRSVLLEPLQRNDIRTLECIVSVEPAPAPLRIGQRVRVTLGERK
jgi:multidrug resistance efflux pump